MSDIPVREQIIDAFIARANAMNEESSGKDYWDGPVSDAPITDYNMNNRVLGIYDTREKKENRANYTACRMEVMFEYYSKIWAGESATAILRQTLTKIQKMVLSDIQCGNLCLNTVETGNEFDIDGPATSVAGGIVVWEVTYRHALKDPTRRI